MVVDLITADVYYAVWVGGANGHLKMLELIIGRSQITV